jgi:hypothetical protein
VLIVEHRAAVLAIAEALMVERTLNSQQIDNIIASAPERARRVYWNCVRENAAHFTAGWKADTPRPPSGIGGKADMARSGGQVAV